MEENKLYKHKSINNRKEVDRTMFPFKDKSTQKAFGIMFFISGLLLISLGISHTALIFFSSGTYAFIGLILSLIGMLYFLQAVS